MRALCLTVILFSMAGCLGATEEPVDWRLPVSGLDVLGPGATISPNGAWVIDETVHGFVWFAQHLGGSSDAAPAFLFQVDAPAGLVYLSLPSVVAAGDPLFLSPYARVVDGQTMESATSHYGGPASAGAWLVFGVYARDAMELKARIDWGGDGFHRMVPALRISAEDIVDRRGHVSHAERSVSLHADQSDTLIAMVQQDSMCGPAQLDLQVEQGAFTWTRQQTREDSGFHFWTNSLAWMSREQAPATFRVAYQGDEGGVGVALVNLGGSLDAWAADEGLLWGGVEVGHQVPLQDPDWNDCG